MTTLIDSHCHLDRLDLSKHDNSLAIALDAARQNDIKYMLNVCIDLEHFDDVHNIALNNEHIYASVGVHPNEITDSAPTVDELVALSKRDKIIAIGETGLDYFRSEGDLSWQHERFVTHIETAKQTNKPLIIHMREATDDTLRLLKEHNAEEAGGIMHCFVEDWETAKKAMDLNLHISFSGIVTFKSAKALQEVATKMPIDRMLVETDSPYLAPVPFRGKPNEPAYVKHVAEFVAELRGEKYEYIAEHTTENFLKLFSLN